MSDGLKKEKRIKLITESLKETVVQSVLARGSRRIGEALLKAHVEGRSLKQVLKEEALMPRSWRSASCISASRCRGSIWTWA